MTDRVVSDYSPGPYAGGHDHPCVCASPARKLPIRFNRLKTAAGQTQRWAQQSNYPTARSCLPPGLLRHSSRRQAAASLCRRDRELRAPAQTDPMTTARLQRNVRIVANRTASLRLKIARAARARFAIRSRVVGTAAAPSAAAIRSRVPASGALTASSTRGAWAAAGRSREAGVGASRAR